MFDRDDPRAALATAPAPKGPTLSAYTPSDYLRFYEREAQIENELERTWCVRGQNAVIVYTEARPGARFERESQIDEWAMLLPDADVAVELDVDGRTHAIPGGTLTLVPPGAASFRVVKGGRIARLFTTRSLDLAARALNASTYAKPNQAIPPLQAWPTPPGGFKVRTYSIDVPDQPGRFGKIWRCTTFMVNYFTPSRGPRDVTKLSPHHHDDFEQYSLAIEGAFIHHLRWAWTPDMRMWRADEHEFCGAPSVAVIPPPAIHTSRGVDRGVNQLVDIFCPPRLDFSKIPGWVLNADDYPLP